jgi:hypothetical protein
MADGGDSFNVDMALQKCILSFERAHAPQRGRVGRSRTAAGVQPIFPLCDSAI